MYTSIIIPTYNRYDQLLVTLQALATQTYPDDKFEVIVVDDGSTDDTSQLATASFPFHFVYLIQANQGATKARNLGANHSHGDLLIFMDDDIELMPETVAALVHKQEEYSQTIVLGTLIAEDSQTEFVSSTKSLPTTNETIDQVVEFTECFTGLLCVEVAVFKQLGMFQDPTGGWPNWDDVDFGYRAWLAGYQLLCAATAPAIHHDASSISIQSVSYRWYRASKSAVRLFRKYPDIQSYLPMFADKTPIDWKDDSARLIARKLLRIPASSQLALWIMEQMVIPLERSGGADIMLHALQRWIIGGYIFCGYRDGLREELN
ncbi:MAG: glycosyltransferase family 2 protein [Chloroflexi bacterium]|nr:glycosyltransferase family 2 protein [Chloroflexota bacterium]